MFIRILSEIVAELISLEEENGGFATEEEISNIVEEIKASAKYKEEGRIQQSSLEGMVKDVKFMTKTPLGNFVRAERNGKFV